MNDTQNIYTNEESLTCDIDAERAVLGSILKSQDVVMDVIDLLSSEDFYLARHQEIFKVFFDMFKRNIAIDMMTTYSCLKEKKVDEIVGGMTYLSRLLDEAIVPSNAKYYADKVLACSKMRNLANSANEIKEMALSTELDPDEVLDIAEKKVLEIASKSQVRTYQDINDVLVENIKRIQELAEHEGELPGISTGFKYVDKLLGGLQNSDLIILAARPGVGKTAFALNIATHASIQGHSVAVFSLEMSATQLGQRILAMTSKVDMEHIKKGRLQKDEWVSLSDAQDKFEELKLYIDDTPGLTPMEMKNKCRRIMAEHGLDLIIVDYLQLMSPGKGTSRNESREKEIASISRAMKILAKEMDCPIIMLSQLSRAPEQRTDHKPQLSDLRDSGAIEQDADIVIFLKRDDAYEKDDEPAKTDSSKGLTCDVYIAKHRNGPTGMVRLAWIPRYTQFANREIKSNE